ncbi:ABC transporter ATP-binding protein [Colwellia sp. MEBiC06753]
MAGDILSVNNLWWLVGQRAILENINFSVKPGEFVGLLGPNGAGKSSLLRCIYRYLTPAKGQVRFNGNDIWQLSANDYAKSLAVVLQESPAQFNLSVFDVVALGLLPHQGFFQRSSLDDQERINQALASVELLDKQNQAFDRLSGGEKQRALIARAIVQQPQLLVMDEPTSHLDVKHQIHIIELAKSLGITVLASFHDLNLASALSDRLLVLDHGRLVADGAPKQVLNDDLLSTVFGVCAQVKPHPQHQAPHITYFYGYQGR